MFTATDVLLKLIEQNRCVGIDDFIQTDVYEFYTTQENFFQSITISSDLINSKGWQRNIFMQEMKLRGFGIGFISGSEGSYYSITIPQVR